MAATPTEFHDLFEKPTFGHVTTMFPNGLPHTSPVWIGYDEADDRLLVNTERHRQKAKNVERNPAVSVSMLDPDNPYRFLSVSGEVETITTNGAREHIDELSQRYFGEPYPQEIVSERIILRIRPERVFSTDPGS
jgi:PPOX class probable F420-dependent enzyme